MIDVVSAIPLFAILVSLVAVPLIILSRNYPNLREAWTLLAAFIKWGLILSMLPGVLAGKAYALTLFDIFPGASFELRVDYAGYFFALIASTLWILTSFYSIGYVRGTEEKKQTRYFASFAVCLSATIGIAFAANLVTFLIFYEILSIATYPLVIHKETAAALRAGRKYLAFALTAGVVLLFAVIWTYQIAGDMTEFRAGGFLASTNASPDMLRWLFVLFIAGAGVKAGIMPLQSWLPAAMVAPTPVSALLHAVAVVKAGVFAILRIVGYVFGPELMEEIGAWAILAAFAGTTIIVASLLAFRQQNLKRRLAYSTIAHLSYIILGASLVGATAMEGAWFHLASHATLKITLFFVAGAIYVRYGFERIDELDGIGRRMPFTMTAFALASLGLVGIPPFNGFLSKLYLSWGSLEAGHMTAFIILLLASLLCAGYLLPVAFRAFFKKAPDGNVSYGEASPWLVVPLCITALISLLLGLFPNGAVQLFNLSTRAAQSVFAGNL